MKVSLIRVRPQWALTDGPPRSRMNELARIVAGSSGSVTYGSYFAAGLDVSPTDDDAISQLAQLIEDAGTRKDAVLIDFAHPRILGAYSRLEWLLAEALRAAHSSKPRLRFVIYMETIAASEEQLRIVSDEMPEGIVELCDKEGVWVGPSLSNDEMVEAFARFVEVGSADVDELASRIIRWRGVFSRGDGDRKSYFKYQYTLEGSAADQNLSALIADYVEGEQIGGIIYDDPATPGWLEPCVQEVAYLAEIPQVSADDLNLPISQVTEAAASAIAELKQAVQTGLSIVVILPAYKNGRGLRTAEEKILSLGAADVRVLAILMDDDRILEGEDVTSGTSARRTVELPRGNSTISVDYFLSVPIDYLDKDHWLVESARTLGEIKPMTMDIKGGSQVGVWGLLDDYGVDLEQPTPATRVPLRWYPQLGNLHDWDARWIVHLLVSDLLERLHCGPRHLLLLVPDEANATRELSSAAATQEGLSVILLPRDVIDGKAKLEPKIVARLNSFRSLQIVALDESVITGGTMKRIDNLVLQHTGRRLDESIAFVSTGPEVPSLFNWRPYPVKADHGHS